MGGVEACHHVPGPAPPVDGLGGVADHDQLGVTALGFEDPLQDGVGVLGLVEEKEVGLDPLSKRAPTDLFVSSVGVVGGWSGRYGRGMTMAVGGWR
jgi:hypothetical protein